jgi:hypothetical protein
MKSIFVQGKLAGGSLESSERTSVKNRPEIQQVDGDFVEDSKIFHVLYTFRCSLKLV